MTTIPSTLTIRRAASADAATMATLVGEIAAHEGQQAHVHVTEAQWRTLLDRPDVIVLLAERDGRAAGYVSAVRQLHLWTGGDVLALDDLYVRPGCRDAGVGRQLMASLAALALPEQLLIRWGVEVDNVDAQRFYRRLGATLRHKVLAAWTPTAYAGIVAGSDQRWPITRHPVPTLDRRITVPGSPHEHRRGSGPGAVTGKATGAAGEAGPAQSRAFRRVVDGIPVLAVTPAKPGRPTPIALWLPHLGATKETCRDALTTAALGWLTAEGQMSQER